MEREFKDLPFASIKSESSGRVRAGICAVTGNIDAANDRIVKGAFSKTLAEGGQSRVRYLWNHSWVNPPVASIKELREVDRSELPAEVIAKAPEATGGLFVKYEFYNNEMSNWIMDATDTGDINELSFAYDVIKDNRISESVKGDPEKKVDVRELLELKLYDVSSVLWGCNSATVANAPGMKNLDVLPLGVIAAQLAMISSQIKAGQRNASSDQKLIDMIHATSCDLGAKCDAANCPDEGKGFGSLSRTSGNPADPELKAITEAIEASEAGAVKNDTPLSDLTLRLMLLRANVLNS